MLEVKNLTKYYGENIILKDLNLQVQKGDVIQISEMSGAGKTTLLRCIAGLEKFESGAIEIGGKTIQSDKIFIPPYQRKIGMVFQDLALWPHMTVWQNVDFASSSIFKNKRERKSWNDEILIQFKIEHKKNKYPGQLSGGEQQRVALTRAVANQPQLLLLDEPLSNLDKENAVGILNETLTFVTKFDITLIIVSHVSLSFENRHIKSLNLVDGKLIGQL